MHNTTRVCLHYVTAECIQRQSEDTCTAQLLSELLAPKQPVDSSWQPQTVAGIVVGGAWTRRSCVSLLAALWLAIVTILIVPSDSLSA